jgi:hypothetical protein
MVCIPRIAAIGKHCQPRGWGCCDEKVDCPSLGTSTCRLVPSILGCSSGGVCQIGKTQGQTCVTSDECSGSLVCKALSGRTYTTCEY